MEWLKANWATIVAVTTVALVVLNVVNRATVHWSSLTGPWYKRLLPVIIFFVTELLSVAQSSDGPGRWKLPLTSKAPRAGAPRRPA